MRGRAGKPSWLGQAARPRAEVWEVGGGGAWRERAGSPPEHWYLRPRAPYGQPRAGFRQRATIGLVPTAILRVAHGVHAMLGDSCLPLPVVLHGLSLLLPSPHGGSGSERMCAQHPRDGKRGVTSSGPWDQGCATALRPSPIGLAQLADRTGPSRQRTNPFHHL